MNPKQQLILGIGTIVFVAFLVIMNHFVVPLFYNTPEKIEVPVVQYDSVVSIVNDSTTIVETKDTTMVIIQDDEMPKNTILTNWYCYTDFETEQIKSSAKGKITWTTKELFIGGEKIPFDKLEYTQMDEFTIWDFLIKLPETEKTNLETKVLIRKREVSKGNYIYIVSLYNQNSSNDMTVYTTKEEDCMDYYAYWRSLKLIKDDI